MEGLFIRKYLEVVFEVFLFDQSKIHYIHLLKFSLKILRSAKVD